MDLPVIDPPGVRLVAGVELAAARPGGLALVALGLAGDDGDGPAPIADLGLRVGSQVEVPARGSGLPEPGADDRDLVARGYADQWYLPPLPGACSGRRQGDHGKTGEHPGYGRTPPGEAKHDSVDVVERLGEQPCAVVAPERAAELPGARLG